MAAAAFLGLALAAAAPGDPPPALDGQFTWVSDLYNVQEDVTVQETIAMDVKAGRALVLYSAKDDSSDPGSAAGTAVTDSRYATLIRNDIRTLFMFWTHRGGIDCFAVPNISQPIAAPSFPGFVPVGDTILGGRAARHYRRPSPSGGTTLEGYYVDAATGEPLKVTSHEGMEQTQTTASFQTGPPDESLFTPPLECTKAAVAAASRGYTVYPPGAERVSTRGPFHPLSAQQLRRMVPEGLGDAIVAEIRARPTPAFGGVAWRDVAAAAGRAPLPPLPKSVDWRAAGKVTAARDQGDCGSCWAFSSAAALETATAVARNATVAPMAHLALQELLDCVDPGTWPIVVKSCGGGWPPAALAYAKARAGGLVPEAAYPYRAVSGSTCGVAAAAATRQGGHADQRNHTSTASTGPRLVGFADLGVGVDPTDTMAAVARYGAVIAVINVLPDFLFYTGGIYNNPGCEPTLAHAVTIVGYGTDEVTGTDYWIVKNSFGRQWGEQGFIRMKRGVNMCGIEQFGWAPMVE